MDVVSVIIPVYNRTSYLRRAVESVLGQSYQEFEVIVVDDGSEVPVVENLADMRDEIRVVTLDTNHGVSKARNTGVGRAAGEWIAFLDSDDYWKRDKLLNQMRWLEDHPDIGIAQSKEIWVRNGVRVNPPKTHLKKGGDIFSESLKRCSITPSSVIMKKDIFSEFRGFNESLPACEDYDLWLRITSGYSVGLINEYLAVREGGRPDQLSASVPVLDRFRVRALIDLINNHDLTSGQREEAVDVLVHKAYVVAKGAEKRGEMERADVFNRIHKRYSRY